MIQNFFPKKSDYQTQVMVKEISNKTRLSVEEIKELDFKYEESTNIYTWKKELEKEKDIEFSYTEIEFLKNRFIELDKIGNITIKMLDICKKIKEA
jgi:hypothetical protein